MGGRWSKEPNVSRWLLALQNLTRDLAARNSVKYESFPQSIYVCAGLRAGVS